MPCSPRLCGLALVVALLAACGAADDETTGSTTSSDAQGGPPYQVLQADDIVYHESADEELVLHVRYPEGDGPWPLVVVYHGRPAGPSIAEALQIAARGAVAVAPQWVNDWDQVDREDYIDGALFDRAACAVGKAQELAGDFGADPTNTTIAGFSAGVHPAGWVGLGAVREDVCDVPLLHQPIGLVLGDMQLVFFEDGWDDSFADPASNATDTTDRFVDPARWDVPDDLVVRLWTTDFRYGRDIGNPPVSDSWLEARDTTGTLVADLASLDAFEDEWIDWTDNALLLQRRMEAAGIDVTHEDVGGGHRYSEPVYDTIEAVMTGGR